MGGYRKMATIGWGREKKRGGIGGSGVIERWHRGWGAERRREETGGVLPKDGSRGDDDGRAC